MSKPNLARIEATLRENDAWMSGDTDQLEAVYGNTSAPDVRPAQYRAGIIGRVARWVYGKPPAPGEVEKRIIHLPVARSITRKSARLLFGDPVIVTEPEGTPDAARARHEYLRTEAKLDELWMKAAQAAAGLGWCYLYVTFNSSLFARPIATVVRPQDARPVFGPGGELLELTIERTLRSTPEEQKKGVVWTHYQRLLPGTVVHSLYKGTADNRKEEAFDLAAHDATRGIRVDGQHESGFPETLTGYDGLSAVIWRNRAVTEGWMAKDPIGCHLGASDFEGVRPIFDQIDARMSGLADAFDDGQGRVVVPAEWIEFDPDKPGAGGVFNLNRKVFTGLDISGKSGGEKKMEVIQFDFRAQEYLGTIDALSIKAVTTIGYSEYTFGFTDGVALTATEIEARTAETRALRDEKIRLIKSPAEEFLAILFAIDAHYWAEYGGAATRPTLEWPPVVSLTITDRNAIVASMKQNESGSTKRRVMVQNGWTEDDPRLAEEVELVSAEFGRFVDDPAGFGG